MTSPKEAIALPRVGEKAPEFTCESYPEGKISLLDYRGKKNVVLAFYPKDDTPGCTKEMCAFTEDYSKFESADTVVFGISTDSVKSHEGFAAKFSLKQHLLADHTHEVGRKYGVVSEDKTTASRALFLIDKNGIIQYVHEGMPENAKVLEAIARL
ncbi:MAG: peroxiredoxin [Candidatus Melainabacteria bacterium]|nr:peroxiredoxin [Candidatus Melainabacteria bacterium]